MQFRDAVLVGPDTYFLTYRLGGQLGTEVLAATPWPAGSYLVMMYGVPGQIELADGLRRRALHYGVGPAGCTVDDPSYQHAVIAFEGLGLRPYSPVHLWARIDAGGSTDINWIRRTQIDGDRWDTPEVPLGEESESYFIRVSQGGAILSEQSTTEPSWRYEAAQKATDGIAGGYDIGVAQVSAKFGPGLFAKMAVTD